MSTPWPAPVAAGPVHGRVAVPGSKSVTNRALLLAALSGGPATRHRRAPHPRHRADGRRPARPRRPVELDGERVTVAAHDGLRGGGTVDCGLAGTVMRFVPPAAALADGPVALRRRPPRPRTAPWPRCSTRCARSAPGRRRRGCPFTLHGTGGAPRRRRGDRRVGVVPVRVRAAALRRPLRQGRHRAPRRQAGAVAAAHRDDRRHAPRGRGRGRRRRANTWRVAPGPIAARDWAVEPDLSNAAVFLAAAAVTGGEVTVAGWPADSTQPGAEILSVLAAGRLRRSTPGAGRDDRHRAGRRCPGSTSTCTTPASSPRPSPPSPRWPTGPSRIRGVAHIRGHETDRLAALATELAALGGDVTETAGRAGDPARPAARRPDRPWRAYADHRIATAGALVGLVVPGREVDDIGVHRQDHPRLPGALGGAARVRAERVGTGRGERARVRRVRRAGAARARHPAPHQAPPRPRRRRGGDGHHRSTAAAGPARPTATRPGRRSPRCGPASWAARRSSSATGSGWSATCPARPDTLARIVRVDERSTVLRRTADDTDPFERLVVANAEQLVIVTAVADPEPRTGFVDRCLVAAYAGGLDAGALPDQGRPRRPRGRSPRSTGSWTCRCS